jgi:LysM repeat protein
MGGAVKSVSKAASKAVGGAAKTVTGSLKNTLKTTGGIASALSKGDLKGTAGAAMGGISGIKDIIKDSVKNQIDVGTTLGQGAASLSPVGSKALSKGFSDINAEGDRGVSKYGDTAIDMAANYASGGTYGLAQALGGAVAGKGLGGLTDPKLLAQLGTKAAAAYGGVDPTLLSGATGLAQGKGLKGAALQAAGSYGGLSADNAAMLGDVAGGDVKSALMNRAGSAAGLTGSQTDIGKSLLGKGDLASSLMKAGGEAAGLTGAQSNVGSALLGKGNLVSALAGAGGEKAGLSTANQGLASQIAGGDLKGAALSKLAGQVSDPTLGGIIKSGSFDVNDIIKNAGKTAAMGGALPGQTYMPGSAQEMLSQGQTAYSDARNIMKDPTSAALGALANTSGGQAVIQKGETLASIAKKNGTTVQELLKANPNIKDANKIVAGAKLILPQAQEAARNPASLAASAAGAAGFTTVADKFMKDANGKTIMGANNAPIANPNYSSDAADARTMGLADEANKPGMWDNIKSTLGGAATAVGGAVSGIGSAIQNNPNAANALLQGAAGIGGYMAGDKARDEQQALIKKQILETQGVDELKKYELGQDREKAYAEQQQFLGDRISNGGYTPAERAMQTEGQLRGARAAAAGRMAGIEQQARMGQGATGSGSALAASLIGAQSGANIQADVERQASAQASENLDKAYGARTGALEQKASTEMNLAQSKDTLDLMKQQQIAAQRKQQGDLAAQQGQATGNLISQGANLGSSLIYSNSTQAQNDQAYNDQMRQAALSNMQNQGTQLPPQVAQQPAPAAQPAPARQPASAPSPKPAALATLANPQGSSGVLAPAPSSTTPAMDAMNKFLTVPGLPAAPAVIANPQAAAKSVIDQKAAQAKQLAADLAKKKAAEAQAALAAKAKSALPAPIASAASKLISGFKIPGLS